MKNIRTLSLFLLLLSCFSCRKNEDARIITDPPPPTTATSGMGGARNWHRSHYYYAEGLHYPTPVSESWTLPDTTFALTVVDDTTIMIGTKQYVLDTIDVTAGVRYFGSALFYYYYYSGNGIAYFYEQDSLVWCYGTYHHTSDFIQQQDLCYSF